MQKKRFLRVFAVLGSVALVRGVGRADIASDSLQSAQWFSKEIGQLMAFQASSTHFLPGDTVGFPGVEVGVAGGVSSAKLDVKGFRALPFNTFDNAGGQINLPQSIPVPGAVLHAKVGLPGGIDVGASFGNLNFNDKASDAKTKFKNSVFGVEVRKQILGGGLLTGVALPDLSVSVAYDGSNGEATRTENYNGPTIGGGSLNADTLWKAKWNVGAITARLVASKKIFIITPFVGVGVTKMMGSADTTVTNTVNSSSFGAVSGSVQGSAKPKETVTHGLAGVELTIFPLVRLNVSGLVAKDRWAGSVGLRVQFP